MKVNRNKLVIVFATICLLATYCIGLTQIVVHALTNEGADLSFQQEDKPISTLEFAPGETQVLTLVATNSMATKATVYLPNGVIYDVTTAKQQNQGLANVTYNETTQQVQIEFLNDSIKKAYLVLSAQESEYGLKELYATINHEGNEYLSKTLQINIVSIDSNKNKLSTDSVYDNNQSNSLNKFSQVENNESKVKENSSSNTIQNNESIDPINSYENDEYTQVVTKDNFLDYFTLSGFASYSEEDFILPKGTIQITPDLKAMAGSATLKNRISSDSSFILKGEIKLGDKTDINGGGDGVSFNFSDSPIGTVGGVGNSLGIGGLVNTETFAFDTYYNSAASGYMLEPDPTNNSSAKPGKSGTPYGAFFSTNSVGQVSIDKTTIQYLDTQVFLNKQSKFVPMELEYDGNTRILTVKLNGNMTWTKKITKENSFALSISGSTGQQTNSQEFIFESFKYIDVTKLDVKKNWEDENDKYQLRPNSVEIELLQDDRVIKTCTLSEQNNWSYTFDNLKVRELDGTIHQYSVKEKNIAGYTPSYSRTEDNDKITVNITNTLGNKPGNLISTKAVLKDDNTDLANQVVQVGDTLNYLTEVTNIEASDTIVNNIIINDKLPEGMSYVDGSAVVETDNQIISNVTVSENNGKISASIDSLSGGQKAQLKYKVTVNKEASGEIANKSQINYKIPEAPGKPDVDGIEQTPEVIVHIKSDVKITKKVNQQQALVGDILTYSIVVSNSIGSGKWTSDIKDQLRDDYLLLISNTTKINDVLISDNQLWKENLFSSEQTLRSGEQVEIEFQAKILPAALNQTIENTATTTDNLTSNKVMTAVLPGAGTLRTKNTVYDAQDQLAENQTVRVGDTLTYIIEAENTADATTVINQVVIDDELPEGLAYLQDSAYVMIDEQENDQAVINVSGQSIQTTIGTITGGQQIKLVLQATVTEEAKGELMNRAQVSYELPPAITRATGNLRLEQTPTATVTVADEMALTMTVDQSKARVGDMLTYTIIGQNPVGSGKWEEMINALLPVDEITPIPGTTTINDQLVEDDIVWTNAHELHYPATLRSGQRLIIQFQAKVQEPAWDKAVELTATATDGKTSDPVMTQIIPNIGILESNKSVYDATGQPITDQVMKVGDTVRYIIEATNVGDPLSVLNQLVIRDPLPEGITYQEGSAILLIEGNPVENAEIIFENGVLSAKVGTLVGGQKVSLQFETTINEEATGEISNIASIDYTIPKLPGDESMGETTKEPETPLKIAPDLSLEVSVSQSEAQIGEILTYTIRGRNITGGGKWQGEIIDKLPSQWLSLVPDTTKVNGEKRADTDVWQNAQELLLNQVLKSGEVVEIEFQAKILPDAVGQLIENTVRTNDGVMSNTATTKIVKKEANEVTTNTTQPSKQTDTSNKKTKNTQKNGQLPKTSENSSVGTSFIGLILVAMVSSYQLNRRKKA